MTRNVRTVAYTEDEGFFDEDICDGFLFQQVVGVKLYVCVNQPKDRRDARTRVVGLVRHSHGCHWPSETASTVSRVTVRVGASVEMQMLLRIDIYLP